MTTYLHAGLEKTGSSAIQEAFYEAREVLAEYGLNYWDISARHNWALSQMVGRKDDEAQGRRGREATPAGIAAHLRAAMAQPADLVISSEGVAHFKPKHLAHLAEVIGDDATVIVYLREPRSWFTSKVQQRLKRGDSYEDALDRIDQFARRTVTDLRDRFATVRLRLYRPEGLLADFAEALDRPMQLADRLTDRRVNVGLPAAAIAAITSFSQVQGRKPSARSARSLSDVGGPPFRLPPADLDALVARLRGDIEWASAELGVDLLALPAPSDHAAADAAVVRRAAERLTETELASDRRRSPK
jgi:hypothetical protein